MLLALATSHRAVLTPRQRGLEAQHQLVLCATRSSDGVLSLQLLAGAFALLCVLNVGLEHVRASGGRCVAGVCDLNLTLPFTGAADRLPRCNETVT